MIGSLGYIQNLIYYHNPFSVPEWTEGLINPQVSRAQFFFENSLLYLNQAIDWTGSPPSVYQPLSELQARVVQKLIPFIPATQETWFIDGQQYLNFLLYSSKSIHEDLAWFGPLFLILFIPTCAYHLAISVKRKDDQRLTLAILTIGFGLTMVLLMGWTPYKGRYFTLAITFCAPFMGVLFQPTRKWLILRWMIAGAAMIIISRTLLYNQSKPLLGEGKIWGMDALSIRTINNRGMEPVIRMVESHVSTESRLATKLSLNSWDYLLFGEHFQRRIIQTDPFATSIDPAWLQEQRVDYLLVEPKERFALQVPAGLELVDEVNGWTLYSPCISTQCQPDPETASELLSLRDKDDLLTIAPNLAGEVGVLELRPNAWGIEQLNGKGILWLGEGSLHGLTGYLWSETTRTVRILVEVEPGPSKSNPESNLQFSFYWVRGYNYLSQGRIIEESRFNQPTTLAFSVILNQGLNEFRLRSQDIAEYRNFTNGDTRPLLILIKHITVEE